MRDRVSSLGVVVAVLAACASAGCGASAPAQASADAGEEGPWEERDAARAADAAADAAARRDASVVADLRTAADARPAPEVAAEAPQSLADTPAEVALDAPVDAPAPPSDGGGSCVSYRCPSVPPAAGGADLGALARWRRWPTPITTDGLRDVWAASDGAAWAVGDKGTALHFEDGAWRAVATGVDVTLNTVAGSAPDDVWAGGEGPTLLHFDGHRWQARPAPSKQAILDFAVVARDEVYLLALDRNRAFRFDGQAWAAMPEPSLGYRVAALWSPGPGRVWMASHARLFTWTGARWADETLQGTGLYTGIHGSGDDDVWLVSDGAGLGYVPALAHFDGSSWAFTRQRIGAVWSRHAHEAWGVGDGKIWSWDGAAWSSTSAPSLRAIAGVPDGRVWAVGDAGAIWSFEPAPAERCTRVACPAPAPPDPQAPRNACGGIKALAAAPGAPCRPCGGRLACAEPDRLGCSGGGALNSCGGCRVMTQPEGNPFYEAPGASCGAGHWYHCDGEDYLSCSTTAGANTCGGTSPLAHLVGERCGDTPDCRYACAAGKDDTVCVCDRRDGGV